MAAPEGSNPSPSTNPEYLSNSHYGFRGNKSNGELLRTQVFRPNLILR